MRTGNEASSRRSRGLSEVGPRPTGELGLQEEAAAEDTKQVHERLLDERGTYDPADFADELAAARTNHDIGTTLWLENDHLRVFESRLEPGQRTSFHIHDKTYFWTVVDAGRGLQRAPDGTWTIRDYAVGDTAYLRHTPADPLIHDLENVGETTLRFVTVEFKR
jgi:beta-alanine degradation protein BauB